MFRGPLVMLGYYGNEAGTAATIEPDGWLHTGDVATMDEDGYFTIVDRIKDVILTAGLNVYPAEIERVLCAHPAVALAAVGGIPDETKGELAKAYVVLRPATDVTREELVTHAAGISRHTRCPARSSSRHSYRRPHPARSCAACSPRSTTGPGRPRPT
jgi:long-chain acyl-CoA synthetase